MASALRPVPRLISDPPPEVQPLPELPKLPTDVVGKILYLLSIQELGRTAQTCKALRQQANKSKFWIEHALCLSCSDIREIPTERNARQLCINLTFWDRVHAEAKKPDGNLASVIRKFPYATEFHLQHFLNVQPADIETLSQSIYTIKKLHFGFREEQGPSTVRGSELLALAHTHPEIESFELWNCPAVTAHQIDKIAASLLNLKHLVLAGPETTGASISTLARTHSALETVWLFNSTNVGDQQFRDLLDNNPNLSDILLRGCSKINSYALLISREGLKLSLGGLPASTVREIQQHPSHKPEIKIIRERRVPQVIPTNPPAVPPRTEALPPQKRKDIFYPFRILKNRFKRDAG